MIEKVTDINTSPSDGDATVTDTANGGSTATSQKRARRRRKDALEKAQLKITALQKEIQEERDQRAKDQRDKEDHERKRVDAARLAAARPLGFALLAAVRDRKEGALAILPELLERMQPGHRVKVEARLKDEFRGESMAAVKLGPKLTAEYKDRHQVKSLGAIFVREERAWFAPGNYDPEAFARWLPEASDNKS